MKKTLIVAGLTGLALVSSGAALAGRDALQEYQINRAIAAKKAQQLAQTEPGRQGFAGSTDLAGKARPAGAKKRALFGHPTTRPW